LFHNVYPSNPSRPKRRQAEAATIVNGDDRVEKHLARLKLATPKQGQIRVMKITDRQYGRMELLIGKRSENEEKRSQQLVFF